LQKNYEYLSDEHAKYIKKLIQKVANKDKNYKIFGSDSHKYLLNETVSLEQVRAFEAKYQVELPEEYVFFITKVGNGGAGPFYGIDPLCLDEEYEKHYQKLSKPTKYNDDYLQFYKKCLALSEKEKLDEDFFEEEYNIEDDDINFDDCLDGVLNINTQGCTFDTLLVLNGSRKGELVYIDWNFELYNPPRLINMTFLEWYQSFFEEVLAGYDTYQYGYYILGDEDALMAKYENADLETKSTIISTFYKFKFINKKTLRFISHFDGVEDVRRLQLILKFDVKKGLKLFEQFFNGTRDQMKIAVKAAYLDMPHEYRDYYYDDMLHFIYDDYGRFDDDLKREALIFIQHTNRLSAGDLLPFVKDKKNSKEIRKSCMYVIGSAKDKYAFIDTFIDILNTTDSEKILAETILVLNIKNEKIAQTYKTLIPKYKDSNDFLIARNMDSYLIKYKYG